MTSPSATPSRLSVWEMIRLREKQWIPVAGDVYPIVFTPAERGILLQALSPFAESEKLPTVRSVRCTEQCQEAVKVLTPTVEQFTKASAKLNASAAKDEQAFLSATRSNVDTGNVLVQGNADTANVQFDIHGEKI